MKRLLVFVFAIMPLLAFATDTICPAGYYPAEYIELEYIESTGTQYIDTGINVFDYSSTLISDIVIKFNIVKKDPQVMFGCADVNLKQYYQLRQGLNGYYEIQSGVGGSETRLIALDIDTHHFVVDNKHSVVSIDENKFNFVNNLTSLNLSIFLFARNEKGSPVYNIFAQIYSFKLKDGEHMLLDFIPVRRLSDGEIGMYDRVEGKFYGNNGTGEFIAGPEIGQSFITDENGDIVCISCPANTYKPNAGNEQCTKCPEHTFSPIGSTQLSDCAKILRVKDYVVYMPLGKRTEHGLCVMSDGKKYCADVYERQ